MPSGLFASIKAMSHYFARITFVLLSLFNAHYGLAQSTAAHGCTACHSHMPEAAMTPAQQTGNGCVRCHAAPDTSTTPLLLAAAPPAPTKEKLPAKTGMQYPMTSPTSRLGDAPNEMIRIAAGPFVRGTNDRLFDEGPQHSVTLPAFDIDRYEVTNMQYQRFIDATQRRSPDHFRNRTYPEGKADHPVTFVSWHDADAYCRWAGKRLPTDEEWEKAARGTDGRTYPWGNDINLANGNTPMRWAAVGQEGDTTPVGAFAAGVSPYGLYDMSGNVWEWTASWYTAYPGSKTESENFGERYKTLKGGSWFDCSFYKCGISAPTYNRAFFSAKTKNDTFGFRCARDAIETPTP